MALPAGVVRRNEEKLSNYFLKWVWPRHYTILRRL